MLCVAPACRIASLAALTVAVVFASAGSRHSRPARSGFREHAHQSGWRVRRRRGPGAVPFGVGSSRSESRRRRWAVSFALLSLLRTSESRALQLIPGGFDTEAVASGNLGPGNPSVYEPTLTSYTFSACVSCSSTFYPYPVYNAIGSVQYGGSISTATGLGTDTTGAYPVTAGSTIASSATAIPNGLHLMTSFNLDSSLGSQPRFNFQALSGVEAGFSDTVTLTGPAGGTQFDVFPTVDHISGNPNISINFSLIPFAGSGSLSILSTPLLACGGNVIGPTGQPMLCGSSLAGDVRVAVSGTVEAYLVEQVTMQDGWVSGFSSPLSKQSEISGTGFVLISPSADLTFTAASAQGYAGPNEAFPTPEPSSLALLGVALAGLAARLRRIPAGR